MTQYQFINLSIYIWTIIMASLLLVGIRIDKNIPMSSAHLLANMCLFSIIYALGDIAELFLCGHTGLIAWLLTRAGDFLCYFCPFTLALLLVLYLYEQIEQRGGHQFHRSYLYFLYLVSMGIMILNLKLGYFYTVDAQNYYRAGTFELYTNVPGGVFLLWGLIVLFIFGRCLGTKRQMINMLFFLIPALSVVINAGKPGISIVMMGINVTSIVVFLFMFADSVDRFVSHDKNLSDTQMTLTLSQMQPHFLYNALSSISQLCKKDPKKASEMADNFAEYLKKNMQDIYASDFISFREELAHLDRYLKIQKMRYGQYLNMSYDIQADAFCLPPLILQPIVENAVRHGLSMKEEGGTVFVSTRETEDFYEVVIADDGVGFDPEQFKKDGKIHLGIDSINKRIALIKGASIRTQSEIGKGTRVTIHIPKEIREVEA